MKSPELRPATAADLKPFRGEIPGGTLRAIVAELDGEILGIGGLVYVRPDSVQVFSLMREGMKPHRKTILRAAYLLADMARECGAVAIADENHANSRRLLRHLGFSSLGPTQYGEVFGWVNLRSL